MKMTLKLPDPMTNLMRFVDRLCAFLPQNEALFVEDGAMSVFFWGRRHRRVNDVAFAFANAVGRLD